MNVVRRLLYAFIVSVVLTGIAVFRFPQSNFVQYTIPILEMGTFGILLLTAISFYKEDSLTLKDKNLLMNGFLVAILVPSFYTAGAFVHQSTTSWSQGEVHWHADYEVIVYGEEEEFEFSPSEMYNPEAGQFCKSSETGYLCQVELVDPETFCANNDAGALCGLSDRTGITKYHEHDDSRIHLEGIFKEREDATLAAFFETFGGELSTTKMKMPTNSGAVDKTEEGEYEVTTVVQKGVVRERKWCVLDNTAPQDEICRNQRGELALGPSNYVISPYKRGPALDDIFIVYDSRNATEVLNDIREDEKYRGFKMYKEGE